MRKFLWLVAPLTVLASGLAVAITFLHYAHADRLGVSGGSLPLVLGAGTVGCLAGLVSLAVPPVTLRSISAAAAIALVASLAAGGILLATLVWAYGS